MYPCTVIQRWRISGVPEDDCSKANSRKDPEAIAGSSAGCAATARADLVDAAPTVNETLQLLAKA